MKRLFFAAALFLSQALFARTLMCQDTDWNHRLTLESQILRSGPSMDYLRFSWTLTEVRRGYTIFSLSDWDCQFHPSTAHLFSCRRTNVEGGWDYANAVQVREIWGNGQINEFIQARYNVYARNDESSPQYSLNQCSWRN